MSAHSGAKVEATRARRKGRIEKTLWVRRSERDPAHYWWSLPLSLETFARTFSTSLQHMRALCYPTQSLEGCADELQASTLAGPVASVRDCRALLSAMDQLRVAPCTVALVSASRSDEELERLAVQLVDHLEQVEFEFAIAPHGEAGNYKFCFGAAGKAIAGVEALMLGRRFGGNLAQVETELLHGLELRANQVARLRLVLEDGGAALEALARVGSRRVEYLRTGQGYTGTREETSLAAAVGQRVRESWRRFPTTFAMFAGLPLFIGAFWARNALARGDRSDRGIARPEAKPTGAAASLRTPGSTPSAHADPPASATTG